MLIVWIVVFIISLAVLVKGADWMLTSAEKIGLSIGLSPFVVGVIIVGVGTSFPEVVSSLAAVFQGATEIVAANAIGSNIANILLIVGFSAIFGRKLVVTKNLIDIDLPLLAISTAMLLGIVWDKQVTFIESIILLLAYVIYLLYTIFHREEESFEHPAAFLPSRSDRRKHSMPKMSKKKSTKIPKPKIVFRDILMLVIGITFLVLGAKYLVEAVIQLSVILNIATGVIAISAVALGTSLPELIVSVKAAMRKKAEIALGTIFGSNVFNALVVIGIPGLFSRLKIDDQTFLIGVPTVALATLLFIISGISKKIYLWEGAMYLMLYLLFIGKLFSLF